MTNTFKTIFTALALLLSFGLTSAAIAHGYHAGPISVEHPWAPASLPGTSTAAAYMTITNTGTQPVMLVGATTPAAGRVEIHSMSMDGGVMRMRPMSNISIPPKGVLKFGPGGYHMMLVGLASPLEVETMVPLTLNFQGAPAVTVDLYVESSPMGGISHH
jgi:hypothetical protein